MELQLGHNGPRKGRNGLTIGVWTVEPTANVARAVSVMPHGDVVSGIEQVRAGIDVLPAQRTIASRGEACRHAPSAVHERESAYVPVGVVGVLDVAAEESADEGCDVVSVSVSEVGKLAVLKEVVGVNCAGERGACRRFQVMPWIGELGRVARQV
ncbi:hypothetical protein [Streptomyces lacrimifluminis]|uniref:hypothetical protein n=1 Tax=Streptomyces lacrimifluminis TaxID=1500077 RepID=UPI00166A24B7|nr:hypothetical protein [Streptomyces lacrimifluminis]